MGKYSLNDIDDENVKSLLNISGSIFEVYEKLRNLEIHNLKDTPEYLKLIESLKSLKKTENSLYKKFDDAFKIDGIIYTFTEGEIRSNLATELKNIVEPSKEILIKQRICSRLARINDTNNNYWTPQNIKVLNIENEVRKDIINSILKILNSYLDNQNSNDIIENLYSFKYNLGFVFEHIENDFIKQKFSINENLYLYALYVAENYDMPISIVENYKSDFIADIMTSFSKNIIGQTEQTLYNKKYYISFILSQITIRAALLLDDEERTEGVKEKFKQLSTLDKMRKRDTTGIDLMLETIEMHNEDRELPRTITRTLNLCNKKKSE